MNAASRDSAPAPGEGAARVNEARDDASKGREGTATSATADDDRDLVRRAQVGEQDAFRKLFERYHRRAYAVAYGVVKNKQDALDVVQDGFVKVHKHIGNFQGTSSFYTWLYRIIMNLAIDHVRRRRHSRGLEYDDRVGRDEENIADSALVPRILDSNPAKTVVRKELMERI